MTMRKQTNKKDQENIFTGSFSEVEFSIVWEAPFLIEMFSIYIIVNSHAITGNDIQLQEIIQKDPLIFCLVSPKDNIFQNYAIIP